MIKGDRDTLAHKKSKLREYAEALIIAALLAILIRGFIMQAFKIPSGSMIPTLVVGDQILVNKFIYGLKIPFTDSRVFSLRQPQRGDIVVFSFPEDNKKEWCKSYTKNILKRFDSVWMNKSLLYLFKNDCRDFIKRVVGTGGDKIEIKNKVVYVNDTVIEEPYAVHKDNMTQNGQFESRDNYGPVIVPDGKIFVMGDNRDQSFDSRFWGFVDKREIKGKAFIVYYSCKDNDYCLTKLKLWKIRWNRTGKLLH